MIECDTMCRSKKVKEECGASVFERAGGRGKFKRKERES